MQWENSGTRSKVPVFTNYSYLELDLGAPKLDRIMTSSRIIGVRLSGNEIASLNFILPTLGYDSLLDFVKALANGYYKANEKLFDEIAKRTVQQLLTCHAHVKPLHGVGRR